MRHTVSTDKETYRRAYEVAFQVNRHLPADCQAAVFEEELDVVRRTLAPRRLEARKVLVVGSAGYIGSVLCAHLLANGYRVLGLDLLLFANGSTTLPFFADPNYEFVCADLTDRGRMAAVLEGVSDVVVLAGLVGDPITKRYPEPSRIINHDGILDLLRQLDGRGLNKVLFVSTCSNYGLIEGDAVADEDFALNPLSLYAKAKVAAERELLSREGTVDYHPTILRFATAFGLSPRMRFDLTVSEFTREMFLGRELLVYDAATWRPYCHVQDFCEVIRRTLEAPLETVAFRTFNAGGDVNNFTKQMIVDAILEFLPDAAVRYQEHGADPRNYRVDFARIREALLFEPRYTVRDGIRELIAALRSNLFADVEARPNFYGNHEIVYPPVP